MVLSAAPAQDFVVPEEAALLVGQQEVTHTAPKQYQLQSALLVCHQHEVTHTAPQQHQPQ